MAHLHSDVGPLLIGVWYRPPCRRQNARERNLASIAVFEDELDTFNDFVGRIIIGDMNVHSERWLRFSNGESPEGLLLESVFSSQGLKQHVKSHLAPYKYPRWVEFVDELPKTATGKIQRFKLRAISK